MNLEELRIFARVAELASFTQAADQLGLAKARVSAAVQQLESHLGARLLQRTTRRVHLTADGEQFLERCKELLADADELQSMFQPATSGLRGRLRVDMPIALARNVVIPRLPEFLAPNPQLEVGISTTDRHVDLVQEGFDCVLRVGALADTNLVARPLGVLRMVNVASPDYLRAHGTPRTLADLSGHRVVHYAGKLNMHGAGWEYVDAGVKCLHPMRSTVVVNGTDAYNAACVAGLGIIQVPARVVQRQIDAGELVELMPRFAAPPMPVSLLYAHRRQLAPRVQAFMNWLTQLMQPYLQGIEPVRAKRHVRRPAP